MSEKINFLLWFSTYRLPTEKETYCSYREKNTALDGIHPGLQYLLLKLRHGHLFR